MTRPWARALLGIAVLVPVLLFGWRALRAPVNFDGAMNLQVASRLADGHSYSRLYGGVREFPHEVQTNGPYLYVAAASIAVLGETQLGYQAANLVFVAAFATAVWVLLKEHRWARVCGPTLVLLGIPSIAVYALGGLGEVPTTFFLLSAVAALVAALRSLDRAAWWVLGASVSFGAALATKTFAVGAVAALGIGLACVVVSVPDRRRRVHVLLASGGVAVVPLVRELHRLVTLGSLGRYRAWWSYESDATAAQAGVEEARGSLAQTFTDHLRILARQLDLHEGVVMVSLVLPLAWVVALVVWRCRHRGVRQVVADPATVLLLVLAVLAATYVLWWLCLLPEAKLWIRRMLPGLAALHILYLLGAAWLVEAGRDLLRRRPRPRPAPALAAAAAGSLLAVAAVVPYAATIVRANVDDLVRDSDAWLDATRDAAAYVEAHEDQRFYGDDWWSAPTVSLMAGREFEDLVSVLDDVCSLDPDRDRVVWDRDAKAFSPTGPSSRAGDLVIDETVRFGSYITIYSVGPGPGRCDDAGATRTGAGRVAADR